MYRLSFRYCNGFDTAIVVSESYYAKSDWKEFKETFLPQLFNTPEEAWEYGCKLSASAHPSWDFSPNAHWSVKPYIDKLSWMDGTDVAFFRIYNPAWEA